MTTTTQTMTELTAELIDKLPATTSLYYADYRDNLDEKHHDAIIMECIEQNSLTPLYEQSCEWDLWEQELGSIDYIIDDTYNEDERDMIAHSDELRDAIVEAIRDRDTSDYVGDIVRNTGNRPFFYSFGVAIEGDDMRGQLKKALKRHNVTMPEVMQHELADNAYYGGMLGVLYYCDSFAHIIKDGKEARTVSFSDPHIAIIDNYNGSGHDVQLKGETITLKWNREHVKSARYYADDVCGLYLPAYDCDPSFSGLYTPRAPRKPQLAAHVFRLGNVYADEVHSGFIRAWNETTCNGRKNAPGHLYEFDMNTWKDQNIPKSLLPDLKEKGGVLAMVRRQVGGVSKVCGWIYAPYINCTIMSDQLRTIMLGTTEGDAVYFEDYVERLRALYK